MATERGRLATHLLTAQPSESLRAFRFAFGALMAIAMVRFFVHGWIDEFYVAPAMHFTYAGFDWVRPWPAWGMYLHFAVLGLAAACVAVGLVYRVALGVFLVGFAYVELLDKTTYLNHYYLVTLLAALMLLLPLDRRQQGVPVARWQIWMMRWQVGLVYFFAGVAKLQSDWLLSAEPLKIWFAANTDAPLIGPLLALPIAPWVASWAAMLMDLTAPFLLGWHKTRKLMFAVVVTFHAATALLFNLGLFPWIMIAGATLFFSPAWPGVLGRVCASVLRCFGVKDRSSASEHRSTEAQKHRAGQSLTKNPSPILVAALTVHFVFQCLWPLRHNLYDTNLLWAEDGFRFSWNVMVMEKAGSIAFDVQDASTGASWRVYPHDDLSPLQRKMMATQPDMILQYARHVADRYATVGQTVAVHADSRVSLNGRPGRPLIDPSIDLARLPADVGARWWVNKPGAE